MLGHSEGSVPQSVWSPVICCWLKPGSTSIWGLGLGDLCLHSRGLHHAADCSHHGGTEPSKIPPLSPSPPGASSQLSCLQPLMGQVFKPLSIQSIHANLLNGQTLLKNKSTLSPPYWRASGWEHSTFTLEHTDVNYKMWGIEGIGGTDMGAYKTETGLAWDGAGGRRWRMTKSLGNPSLLYAVNLHSGK